jgi:hypothetical protein
MARRYDNITVLSGRKTNPKRTQFKPNFRSFLPPKWTLGKERTQNEPNSCPPQADFSARLGEGVEEI